MALDVKEDWVEVLLLVFIVIAFVFVAASPSALSAYVLALLSGALFGGYWWHFRAKPRLPFVIIIIGFVAGWLVGMLSGNKLFSIVMFYIGMAVGYAIHKQGIVRAR